MDVTDTTEVNPADLSRDQLKALIAGVGRKRRKATLQDRNPDTGFELSSTQQGVWLVAQDPVASAAYNIRMALEVRGPLDLQRLNKAFDLLIERHNVLRTAYRFDEQSQRPLQYVQSERTLNLVPEAGNYSEWLDSLKTMPAVELDLRSGEVVASRLKRFDDQHWGLVLDLHHIAFDGWSIGVLLKELRHFYLQPEQPLPPLTQDYIGCHQQRNEQQLSESLAWWEQNLSDLPISTIPSRQQLTEANRWQGGCVEMDLGLNLTGKLETCAETHQMSVFMVFAAALQYLLGRYNDQQDAVVGTYSAGREGRESEALIGCFINNLVLRNCWDEQLSVADFLSQSRSRIVDAFTHQQVPFAEIVKTIGIQGDGHPLYQVGLVMQQEWGDLDVWGDLQVSAQSPGSSLAHMDLEVYVWPGEQGYRLVFNYSAGRYTLARMERMAEHFRCLLDQFCSDSEQPLAKLEILTKKEKQVTENLLNAEPLSEPGQWLETLFHHLNHGTGCALEVGENRYDYSALAERVAQWQKCLVQRGCKEGDRIAFAGQRGLNQVAAMLAIWINHACYVPIDANLPEARIKSILDDAKVRLVLADGPRALRLSTPVSIAMLPDESAEKHSRPELCPPEPLQNPLPENSEFALLYTSGSTGVPKGVRIGWAAVAARLAWGMREHPPRTSDRVLQRTSLNFVDGLWEILETLLAGARLVVAENAMIKDGRALAQLLAERKVSRAYVVPGILQLLTSQSSEPLPEMQLMLSSAERISPELLNATGKLMPNCQLLNLYGSTEVNDVAACSMTAKAAVENRIGKPMPHAAIAVVDRLHRSMPLDCPGLLYVGGDHLPLGYTNQSIDWLESNGERRFPMNDRAIVREAGVIDLCGRVDDLVKVRGHRVELAEVRLQLAEATGDSRACALLLESENGETILAGVWENDASPAQVRQAMLNQLPEYMVPQRLSALETIPLLHSGKTDFVTLRKQLSELPPADVYDLPPVARPLAAIWCELLGCDGVSLQDSFFALGGHSLLVAQLAARMRKEFKMDVEMATLFRLPLLQDQLDWLAQSSAEQDKSEPGFEPKPPQNSYPLSSPQKSMWFLQQFNRGQAVGYNMCYGLRLNGEIDPVRLGEVLNRLVARHGVLRTRFVEEVDAYQISQPVQQLKRHAFLSLEYSEVGQNQTLVEALQEAVDEAQSEPFHLDRAPLMRCALLEKEQNQFGLMLCVHHIIADGWTMGLLVQDICDLYNGEPVSADTPLYVDYTLWQQERLAQPERKDRLEQFWQTYLTDSPRLNLPLDKPRDSDALGAAQMLTATVSADDWQRVKKQSRSPRAYDAVLSRFALALRLWGAGDDQIIGMMVANRHLDPVLEQIAGFFANTLPVRINLGEATSLTELQEYVRNSVDQVMAHQELPYDHIVHQNNCQQGGKQAPLLQAVCVLQNTPDIPFQLGGVEAELLPLRSVEAKFELTLQCYESEGELQLLLEFACELISPARARELLDLILEQIALDESAELTVPGQQKTLQAWVKGEAFEFPADMETTLPEALKQTGKRYPEKGLRFIEANGSENWLSYAQLYQRAKQLASGLQQGQPWSQAGQPVIVLSNALQTYVENFWAVMLAGGIPVTLAAAENYDDERSGERLLAVWQHLKKPLVICDGVCAEKLSLILVQHPDMQLIEPANLRSSDIYIPWTHQPDDLAILQLSSGSTGTPKCIQQSHNAITRFSALCGHSRDYQPEHISLNWLSFDHVGGLLFTHLRDICLGREQIHLATHWVLEDPLRWPLTMARFGVTHSWSPNFGYKLIAGAARQQPERVADLSAVVELINGGEMVVADTLRDINDAFQPWQLSDKALSPAFGMAECCTVIVGRPAKGLEASVLSSDRITLGADQVQLGLSHFVSLGPVIAGTEMRIVDDNNQQLNEFQVGRFQLRGPTVTSGYFGAEAATGKALLDDGWFDTGDLALLAKGELYMTGRGQEMIVVNGINFFCHELEACAEQISGVKPTWVAAVGYQQGEKEAAALFLVAEPGVEKEALVDAVREHLASQMQFYPSHIQILTEAQFPKTVSGKIQRRQLVEKWLKHASVAVSKLDWLTLEDKPAGRWGMYDDASQWAASDGLIMDIDSVEDSCLLALRDTLITLPERWQGSLMLRCNAELAVQLHAWVLTLTQEYSGLALIVVVADKDHAGRFPSGQPFGFYRWHQNSWQSQIETPSILPASKKKEAPKVGYSLVTGATGGIARVLIPYLCEQGRKLVLLTRRSPEPEFEAELEISYPGQCHWLQTDISNSNKLSEDWKSLRKQDERFSQAPETLYHLAGNFTRQPMEKIDARNISEARVARSQAVVALETLLASLASKEQCRWFHFSSLNGCRGGPGMASYNAACGELRDIAIQQRAQGRAAWWLGWSAWKDTGMSCGNIDPRQLKAGGLQLIEPVAALALFEHINQAEPADYLLGAPESPKTSDNRRKLADKLPTELSGALCVLVAHVLDLNVCDPQTNFFDLGGSSLELMQLQRLMQSRLQLDVDITTLLQYPSVSRLCAHLRDNKNNPPTQRRGQRKTHQRRTTRTRK